jgi:hypothetical protein
MASATNRRAVLGAVLAAGAVAVPALPSFAAVETPGLSAVDRRVLDLWNRRHRLQAALDRLWERVEAAQAGLSEKEKRSGCDALVSRWEEVADKRIDIGLEIQRRYADSSILALAASLLVEIEFGDDEERVLQIYHASLAAIRPQLVGSIAADADRVLAQKKEEVPT